MITQFNICELQSLRGKAEGMAKSAKTMARQAEEISGDIQQRMDSGEMVERGKFSLQIETKVSSPRLSWKDIAASERGDKLGHTLTEAEVKTWSERMLQDVTGKSKKVLKVFG